MTEFTMPDITDTMRAVAILSLRHRLLPPRQALKLVSNGAAAPILVRQLLEQVGEQALLRSIANELNLPFYDLSQSGDLRVDEATVRRCDMSKLREYQVLPLLDDEGKVSVAFASPNVTAQDYLRTCFPEKFTVVLAAAAQIRSNLQRLAALGFESKLEELPDLAESRRDSASTQKALETNPIVEWVDITLGRSVAEGTSDLHFSFLDDGNLSLKFRIDGILFPQRIPPKLRYPSRAKEVVGILLSRCVGFDPTNTIEPQDGSFRFTLDDGVDIDVRVSVLPQATSGQPLVVLRLLDRRNIEVKLDDMGFSAESLTKLRRWLGASQGTIIVTGPTGSGKSTTLYSSLQETDYATKNVITVENPIEYRLEGINQTPIREDLGDRSVTFPRALRGILRCDPDIIMVGEIRDKETAKVSMDAAITGHLVITTLHTNNALGVYPRLSEMGVEAPIVAEAVSLIISQRLIRKVHDCAIWDTPTLEESLGLKRLGITDTEQVKRARGCAACRHTGYRGRLAVAEFLEPTYALKELVAAGATAAQLQLQAREDGFITISSDAARQVREGVTTVEEAMRALAGMIVEEEPGS